MVQVPHSGRGGKCRVEEFCLGNFCMLDRLMHGVLMLARRLRRDRTGRRYTCRSYGSWSNEVREGYPETVGAAPQGTPTTRPRRGYSAFLPSRASHSTNAVMPLSRIQTAKVFQLVA